MFWKKKKSIEDILMKVENFKKNFPPDVEVPSSLICLLEYQEQKVRELGQRTYSGFFSLFDKFWLSSWEEYFDDPTIGSHFIPFGLGGDGSMYLFWMYRDLPIESLPIVFLGSSWAGSTIVADNLNDFLALLTLGIEQLGYVVSFPEYLDQRSTDPETHLFRPWMQTRFGILDPESPQELVQKARNNHPDLMEWLYQKTGIPPERFERPPWI